MKRFFARCANCVSQRAPAGRVYSESDSDSEEMTLSLRSGSGSDTDASISVSNSYSESPWAEWSPGSFLGYKAVRIKGMEKCFAVLTLEVSSVVPVFNSQHGGRTQLVPGKKMRVQAPVFVQEVRLVGPEKKMLKLTSKTDSRGADTLALHSDRDKKFEYRLGEVSPEPRDPAGKSEVGGAVRPGCGVGIHFFIDVNSAVQYLGNSRQLLVSDPYPAPSSST